MPLLNRRWILASLLVATTVGCGGSSLPPPRTPQPPSPFSKENVAATQEPAKSVAVEVPVPKDNIPAKDIASSSTPAKSEAEQLEPEGPTGLAALSANQRYDRSVSNLKRIGEAIAKYVDDKGHYPHRDMNGASLRYRLQSWRVALLPYLGETELYQLCESKEYWNAPENKHMLTRIPDVYRSNAEDETRCNYLFVVGPGTCFAQNKSPGREAFEDGIDNTILVVEVKDSQGVVWTNPTDLEILTAVEKRPFATWNNDGFLALLANGEVVQVSPQALQEELRAMLTIAGGEQIGVQGYLRSKSEAKLKREAIASATNTSTNRTPDNTSGLPIETSINRHVSASEDRDVPTKTPVPTSQQQSAAMEIVKQLYLSRYQDAAGDDEKTELAKEMYSQTSKTGTDVAGQYVMLTTAKRIAIEHDDLETAKKCLDKLVNTFDVDEFPMRVALLRKSGSITTEKSFDTRLMDEARRLIEEAIVRDDYAAADDMAQVAISAARRLAEREDVAEITRRQRDIDKMEAAYRRVQQALSEVGSVQGDPLKSELVGRYFCLMKGDWETGLPHLARGDDAALRRLAQRELDRPGDAANQLALADQWWDMVDQARSMETDHVRRRALLWYEAALSELPQGLAKLKAELRIMELKEEL